MQRPFKEQLSIRTATGSRTYRAYAITAATRAASPHRTAPSRRGPAGPCPGRSRRSRPRPTPAGGQGPRRPRQPAAAPPLLPPAGTHLLPRGEPCCAGAAPPRAGSEEGTAKGGAAPTRCRRFPLPHSPDRYRSAATAPRGASRPRRPARPRPHPGGGGCTRGGSAARGPPPPARGALAAAHPGEPLTVARGGGARRVHTSVRSRSPGGKAAAASDCTCGHGRGQGGACPGPPPQREPLSRVAAGRFPSEASGQPSRCHMAPRGRGRELPGAGRLSPARLASPPPRAGRRRAPREGRFPEHFPQTTSFKSTFTHKAPLRQQNVARPVQRCRLMS